MQTPHKAGGWGTRQTMTRRSHCPTLGEYLFPEAQDAIGSLAGTGRGQLGGARWAPQQALPQRLGGPEQRLPHVFYMFAQHHMEGLPPFLMRGAYEHDLVRTSEGWKLTALTRRLAWVGNPPAAM